MVSSVFHESFGRAGSLLHGFEAQVWACVPMRLKLVANLVALENPHFSHSWQKISSLQRMSEATNEHFVSVSAVLFATVLMFLGCLFNFFWIQTKSVGWLKNQFVVVTLLASTAQAIFILLTAFEDLHNPLNYAQPIATGIGFSRDVMLAIMACMHVCLVYMRSVAVFESSTRYLKAIKTFVILMFLSSALAVVFSLAEDLATDNEDISSASTAFNTLTGFFLILVDIVSTFKFSRSVWKINERMQNVELHSVHVKQTNFIALRSAIICAISFIAVVLFASSSDLEDVVANDWMEWLYQTLLAIVCILWMDMKIQLDKMTAVNVEPKVQTKSNNSKQGKQETGTIDQSSAV
jgi:hypothetical protein